jgi:hypothetical protein
VYNEDESQESDYEPILPTSLIECDVLEMDYEDAEYEILQVLKMRPRVLIVELYPVNIDPTPTEILDIIQKMR